jgi:hypothetical protein
MNCESRIVGGFGVREKLPNHQDMNYFKNFAGPTLSLFLSTLKLEYFHTHSFKTLCDVWSPSEKFFLILHFFPKPRKFYLLKLKFSIDLIFDENK